MSLSSQIKVPAQVKGAVGGGSGGGATSLDGLSDVAITSAASGDFLRNNGTNFVNTPLSAADISIMSPKTTTGDYQHYVLTDSRIVETDGVVFAAKIHTTSGAFCRLALNGGTERGIMPATAGLLVGGRSYLFTYDASQGYYYVISKLALTPDDLPDLGFAQIYLASNLTGQGGSYATVTVAFSTVYFNTKSNFSFAGGVATCLIAGRYQIVSQLARTAPGYHFIRVNSNNPGAIYTTAEAWTQCVLTIDLQVGDTVRTSIASSGAATIYAVDSPFVGSGDTTWMSLRRVA